MGQAPPRNECNLNGEGMLFVKAGEFGERRPVIRVWTTKPLSTTGRKMRGFRIFTLPFMVDGKFKLSYRLHK